METESERSMPMSCLLPNSLASGIYRDIAFVKSIEAL